MSILLLDSRPYPKPAPDPEPVPIWIGSDNYWVGRRGAPVLAVMVHTMVGTLAGTDGWFNNPRNTESSAHYGVGLDGEIHQYVARGNTAWHAGQWSAGHRWPDRTDYAPNRLMVGVETEDLGNEDEPVTDAQYRSTLWCARWAVRDYPSVRYVVAHRAVQPSRGCPSPRWYATGRLQQLSADLGVGLVL